MYDVLHKVPQHARYGFLEVTYLWYVKAYGKIRVFPGPIISRCDPNFAARAMTWTWQYVRCAAVMKRQILSAN